MRGTGESVVGELGLRGGERVTYTGVTVRAWCDTCGKSWVTKNAQGVAAQHCDRYAHVVHVEIARSVSYYPPGQGPDDG